MKKSLTLLTLLIALASAAASITGLVPYGPDTRREVSTIHGGTAVLDGKGLYRNDTVSYAAQARGQDAVTLLVGIPLLLTGLILARRVSLRGRLIHTGSLGYFLYTYASYSYLSAYNGLFLLYTALYGLSLFGLIAAFREIDSAEVAASLSERFPRRFLGGYMLFMGIVLTLLWLGRIVPPLIEGAIPPDLETYTTLVIQANDLAVIIPAVFLTGILILRRSAFGITLGAVLFMKMLTLALALFAMMIAMACAGTPPAAAETAVFTVLLGLGLGASVTMLRSVRTG